MYRIGYECNSFSIQWMGNGNPVASKNDELDTSSNVTNELKKDTKENTYIA